MADEHRTESAGITAPHCASLGCQRAGFVKSEQWGAYLCSTHALYGPKRKHPDHPCPTKDCPGDGRYAAPGRMHREGCVHPLSSPGRES